MNPTSDVPSLHERFDRLERSVVRYRITTVLLLAAFIAVASVATVAANSAATQTIRHLRVVDARGVDRVDIDETGIAIADSSGTYREILTVDAKSNAPVIEMRSHTHSPLIDIVGNQNAPFVRLWGANRHQRVYLGVTDANRTLLEFDNRFGNPIEQRSYAP